MDEDLAHQILDELFEHLEDVETQSAAILHFLKAKGIATDKQLAPYFEKASTATSVRWVAERARINHLLASAVRFPEKTAETKLARPAEMAPPSADNIDTEANSRKNERGGKESQRPNNGRKANAESDSAASEGAA